MKPDVYTVEDSRRMSAIWFEISVLLAIIVTDATLESLLQYVGF